MVSKAALFLSLALSASMVLAQDEGGALIEGEAWAFLISAPEGWVLDQSSLSGQGIEGLFYKAGKEFSFAELYMYIVPTTKKPGEAGGLAKFVQTDAHLPIQAFSLYTTGMDYRFYMRDFEDPNDEAFKVKAYYEGDEAFFSFLLVCNSAEERDRERWAFRELLDSFIYIRKE